MKILQVTARMVYGGLSLHVLTLAKGLRARGHRVEIASLGPGPLLEEFEKENLPVSVVPLPGESVGRNPLHVPRLVMLLKDVIRDSGADIVHTHGPSAHFFAGMAAQTSGRPVLVASVHGSHVQFASGHVAGSGRLERGLKKFQYGAVDRLTARFADRMVAVCEATAAELVNDLRIPSRKVAVVHNGIEEQKVTDAQAKQVRRQLGLNEDEQMIVYAGRVAFHKGCTFLMQAMKRVAAKQPRARLVVVGEGPLEEELKRYALRKMPAGQVIMTGSRPDAAVIIAASDLVVLPSLSEGLPLMLLEAAMLGRAMVASDVGGIPEVVIAGQTGLLVPPRDPGALAEAILRLLDSGEELRRMGVNARQLWQKEYAADRMVDKMESLYLELLASRTAAGQAV